MKDPLPIPAQLEKQLSKCKTVRDADTFFKSREKTKQEIASSKAKLPPIPLPSK
eukprot:CAMPEP_0181105528 /NCGR_PEP_ID=MMETSP1071-20121207/16036_1 /TAXON_ID=35127 /ORGANISM="Thalassiosira sp., Strain NH16" /LENGTH=53 /DNA_ID=CAMNT_0023188853 /DNA_START=61 /DNA_END=222 /DNA_ORIENTATION=-